MSAPRTYPVRVEARLEEPLNRGLWLVKWLLLIPHLIVLGFLWVAFLVLTAVAFFAILITGRYPRAIFDFNVGVLRWTWRVEYYGYSALGTDRYPPFTLGPAPDYPATLEIDYPVRLSRGLVLVKWWLLAIPHYLLVWLFTSGGVISSRGDMVDRNGLFYTFNWGGLIGLLTLVAAIALLFTGRYPRGVFDFVIGLNRWTLRVAAYAALMTDEYPPFRLDAGEHESGTSEIPAPPTQNPNPAPAQNPAPAPEPAAPHRHSLSTGAIVALTLGSLLAFGGVGAAVTGTGVTMLDHARGPGGFVSTDTEQVTTATHALVAGNIEVAGQGVAFLRQATGQVRIQVTGDGTPIFIGIAQQRDVDAYLRGVAYDTITHLAFTPGVTDDVRYERHPGTAPERAPGTQPFWTAQAGGPGTQTLTWDIQPGNWAVVVMNADGSAPLSTGIRLSGTLPWLGALATGLVTSAVLLLLAGGVLILVGARRPARTAASEPTHPRPVPTALR